MTTTSTTSRLSIPSIDFQGFRYGNLDSRKAVATQIIRAGEEYGFFYLFNSGVPQDLADSSFDAARNFFALPLEVRMACKALEKNQNRGYQAMFETKGENEKPDGKESFDMGFPFPANDPGVLAGLPFHGTNNWPALPGFRALVEALYYSMLHTGHDVLRAIAVGLEVDDNFFAGACTRPSTNMRLVHYPPAELVADVTDKGARAHADRGLITLLLNDKEEGLEVRTSSEEWIGVPPLDGALIINIGDLMTRWTNGRLRSAFHRVINRSGRERYSIPQFHHPDYRTMIDSTGIPNSGTPRDEPVMAGEFVAKGFGRDRKSWQTVS
jgi:isopenicillin N synthase-like dioxygenase